MKVIQPDMLKKIWERKLKKDWRGKDLFNIYIDSPFCYAPGCKFCIYKPTIIDSPKVNKLKDEYYAQVLPQQIDKFGNLLQIRKPDTAYFGGGTSSLMSIKQMTKIFEKLQQYTDFRGIKEKHFEFNPLSATDDKIDLMIKWGFTHMTFGFQTFNQDVLRYNGRVNVKPEKMKMIFEKLEKKGLSYNIDFVGFIYKDDLEEDMEILRRDLEFVEELNPQRITLFPNYKKISGRPKIESKPKIEKMREVVREFVARGMFYDEANMMLKKIDDDNLLANHTFIRKGIADNVWGKIYNSSSPWNHTRPRDQNVLAFGGWGIRKPYSYIGDTFWYQTVIDESGIKYELRKADIFY
ncbi:radical SAM protein [Nanoarchaeota archaeon]